MIKLCDNINDIVNIWQEAFGDTKKEILFFVNNVKNARCLAYYDNEKAAALMYVVDCKVKEKSAFYVYAACTLNEYRRQGLMTQLLSYANKQYAPLCLIPANESLIDYYSKRGFRKQLGTDCVSFNEIPEIEEYLFEGCELEEPVLLMYEGD